MWNVVMKSVATDHKWVLQSTWNTKYDANREAMALTHMMEGLDVVTVFRDDLNLYLPKE